MPYKEERCVSAIDWRLQLLKNHFPYFESDHVLNIAFNALSGGRCLDDLELTRNDEAYLNLIGATRIPDPATAGDFCRRFATQADIDALHDAIDGAMACPQTMLLPTDLGEVLLL